MTSLKYKGVGPVLISIHIEYEFKVTVYYNNLRPTSFYTYNFVKSVSSYRGNCTHISTNIYSYSQVIVGSYPARFYNFTVTYTDNYTSAERTSADGDKFSYSCTDICHYSGVNTVACRCSSINQYLPPMFQVLQFLDLYSYILI